MIKPLVSIVMITYGHEKYIKKAIHSVLIQKCNFEIELIIANDKSPDKTDQIVRDILNKNPKSEIIKYSCHEQNKGVASNFLWALGKSQGKFIAICEGDDYWIDPLKLQKQVEFLKENEEYIMCSHKRIIVDENDYEIIDSVISKEDYHTQCLVFKNVLQKDFLKNEFEITNGDTFLISYLLNFGKGKILDFTGSAYRVANSGIWSNINFENKYLISSQSFNKMKQFFNENGYKNSVKIVDQNIIDNKIRYLMRGGRLRFNEHVKIFSYLVFRLKASALKSYLFILFKRS